MKIEEDISLILSGVRALTGEITPPLRSASIELSNKKIIFKCVFDETATEDDFELLSAAATEIIADFPDYVLEEIFQKIPQPEPTNPLKNVLFHRHESNYWK
ncbi:MAG: hypothetical protein E6H07_10620 [Bacteroidetes bacterium]|nr:MAG: hypothetical protein E6H07_10620 [Bacteroidota bacterium]